MGQSLVIGNSARPRCSSSSSSTRFRLTGLFRSPG
jgi:hypothetical protein